MNLEKNSYYDTQLKIRKKFLNSIQQSLFFIDSKQSISQKNGLDLNEVRYSDRFSKSKKKDYSQFRPDWSRFPKELKICIGKDRKKTKRKQIAPELIKRKIKRINEDEDIDKLVETITKDEEEEKEEIEEDEEKKKEPMSEEENEGLEGDEEDFEEVIIIFLSYASFL